NVARTGGSGPGNLASKTENAICQRQAAGNKQAHRHGSGVPSARYEAFKHTRLCGSFIQMEGLGIKLLSELFDAAQIHHVSSRRKFLPDVQVIQVELLWCRVHSPLTDPPQSDLRPGRLTKSSEHRE